MVGCYLVDDAGLWFLEKGCPLLKVMFLFKVINCNNNRFKIKKI